MKSLDSFTFELEKQPVVDNPVKKQKYIKNSENAVANCDNETRLTRSQKQ